MTKPACSICENKGAVKLQGNRAADQRLCFCYIDTIHLHFKPLAIFSRCTAQFVSDQVVNPNDRLSRDVAQFIF